MRFEQSDQSVWHPPIEDNDIGTNGCRHPQASSSVTRFQDHCAQRTPVIRFDLRLRPVKPQHQNHGSPEPRRLHVPTPP
jgi:hypothetical protein